VTDGGIIYQGTNLPARFQGRYICGDLLGHGVQWHEMYRWGSTFTSSHGGYLLEANDKWFASTDVTMSPDGAVYVADWCDQRTAHPDPDADWDRSNGRIYRISAKGTKPIVAPDLRHLTTPQLIALLDALRLDLDPVHLDPWDVGRGVHLEASILPANPAVEGLDALPFEHDVARIVFQAGPLQQSSQWHTRPFCVADGAQLPLRSSSLGDEKDPTITRALQSGDPRLGPHLPQFLVAQRQRVPNRAVDPQPITGEVELWRREMAAYVEQFCRGQV